MAIVEFNARSERLRDGTWLVRVMGELDLFTAPEFERALLAAEGDATGAVTVDLSGCTFLDSTALAMLVEANRRLGDAIGGLRILGASAAVRRPFEITGLDRLFAFLPVADGGAGRRESMNGWRDREARNQALFREVNERIEQVGEGFATDGQTSFRCECGNRECAQTIDLSHSEYERVRAHSSRFVVALNHENPEAESVVEQNSRFAIVEVYAGAASRIARGSDPRSQHATRRKAEQREESP